MTTNDLLLRYSHNVVEHLGLKLYQNRPTRVIAEIVSNSWDADAHRVQVNTSMGASTRWIAVLDDGCGMNRDDLATSYLVIGRGRRSRADDKSHGGRRLMGRKGIGKLAPFGIARIMDVVTVTRNGSTPTATWLRFDLSDLLTKTDGEVLYRPRSIVADGALEALPTREEDATGQVDAWRQLVAKSGSGTAVIMTTLSLARAISNGQLLDSLGRRFTVAVGQDFAISVNGETATVHNTLPEFEFRIPESGEQVEEVGGRSVSYWIGFVKSAKWPQDQAGVGVYAHGKIAQDRPFTFGVKGKEIFTRYMFGVVVAEWLDELEGDVISTDRTSVNWEAPELETLFQWGQKQVRIWVSAFEKWREKEEKGENRRIYAETRGGAASVTEPEREEIIQLVSTITPAFGKDVEAKRRLVNAVSDAWVQKPMRRLVRDLWESVGRSGGLPPTAFASLVERLSAHSVPESLNLAVVFAQRAFALTRLHDYVHHGSEVDLQKLVERFPWIVEPDLAVLTANQHLKTAVRKAEELGQIPTGRRVNVGGVPEVNKPDFVFLSSPCDLQMVIVELKNPQADLTIENRAQLQDYLMWLEAHYPHAERRGYLIGRKPAGMTSPYQGLSILPWTDVLRRSRARHLELLSAMLMRTSGGGAVDMRIADAIELGGHEAREFLERLADEHQEIKELMATFSTIE